MKKIQDSVTNANVPACAAWGHFVKWKDDMATFRSFLFEKEHLGTFEKETKIILDGAD